MSLRNEIRNKMCAISFYQFRLPYLQINVIKKIALDFALKNNLQRARQSTNFMDFTA